MDGFGGYNSDQPDDEMLFANSVSGTSIGGDDSHQDVDFTKILSDLNKDNSKLVQDEQNKAEEERLKKEEADKAAREEALAKLNAERFAREQEEKRIREEEEARLEEEMRLQEEAKRESSILRKMGRFASSFGKKNKSDSETQEVVEETKVSKKEEKERLKAEARALKEEAKESKREQKEKELEEKNRDASDTKLESNTKNNQESKEEDWKYIATHDEPTKLKNNRAYNEAMGVLKGKDTSVMFLDINNLKYANDMFGHSAGNRMIFAVADTLRELFGDDAYRIGGDEFVVFIHNKKASYAEDVFKNASEKINSKMNELTKTEETDMIYSVSIGWALCNDKKSIQDLVDEADKKMYESKQTYKKRNPKQDARKEPAKKEDKPEVDYDQKLQADQRELKEVIRENHIQASKQTTERIMLEVQSRHDEILAILIASPTFDHLFIIQDVNTFVGIVMEMENLIDYSYLYVVYEGGPQYYGADEYYSEVTHIFEAIATGIKTGKMMTNKDIQKIKGINIFKNIYIE